MSLTIIAVAGVLLGFLCLLVGFFMDTEDRGATRVDEPRVPGRARRARAMPARRRVLALKKRAA